jgi:hypothetical protein
MLIECKRQRLYQHICTLPLYSFTINLPARVSYIQHLPIPLRAHILHSLHPTTLTHRPLNILAQPPNPLPIPLPHNHAAHEDLNRPDALKRHLALARRLVKAQHAS